MTLPSRSFARAAAALAAALLALLATATLAAAHTTLRVSNPEEGAEVESLTEVRLEFNGDLLDIGTELSIVDAAGEVLELQPEFPSTNAVTARVERAIANGDAELVWRVVAEDGHPIEGTVGFTYVGEASAAPTASADPEPTAAASEPAPSASAGATDEPVGAEPISAEVPEDESEEMPAWALPVIALAAVGTAAVAIILAVRRKRP